MHVIALIILALVGGQPQSQLVGFAPNAAACEAVRGQVEAKVIAGLADNPSAKVAVVCVPVDLGGAV